MENAARMVVETRLLTAINGWAGHFAALDTAGRVMAVFGVLPLAAAAVFLAICSTQGWRRWGGCVTLISIVPAFFAVQATEGFFCRPRPFLCHPVRLLLCAPDGISYPSVEVGVAAALAFGLFAYTKGLRWAVLPYLALIGLARVYCGIEYPLDQAWAALAGCLVALVMILALNPRFIFLKPDGWPVGAAGTLVVLAAIFLYSHTPEASLPAQQSTSRMPPPVVSAEEKNLIRGMSPVTERKIADALLKLHLAGRIRRIEVGDGEAISVAAVKFDAGPESKPFPRDVMEREALAIIRATLPASPNVAEVDVFGVTNWVQRRREFLKVAYSVSARRQESGFLFAPPGGRDYKSRPNIRGGRPNVEDAGKLLSKLGLIYYRVGEGE